MGYILCYNRVYLFKIELCLPSQQQGVTMAGIDKTNLRSMVRDIAKELDKKDNGGEDNKIEASIWNEFVADKGGKQIRSHISLDNAIKSITTYLARNSAKTGESFGDLADKWFNKEVTPVDETTPIEETNPTEGAEPVKKTTSNPIAKKAPTSEIPPQKFAFPNGIPEVKPLDIENTKKALYYLYVGPGVDIQNKRAQGQTEGKRLANLIKNSSDTVINNATKENAAYAFLEIQKQIPSLGRTWNPNAALVLKGLYDKLIQRAKDLKIDILKETNLRTIDFEKANSYEKVSICTEISNAIKAHDECKINEMNMFNSISKPNPKLAYATIKDKVSGKTYEYDGTGKIKSVKNKNGAKIVSTNEFYTFLTTDNKPKTQFNFDKDGSLNKDYTEECNINGHIYKVKRNEDGKASFIENNENDDYWAGHDNGYYMGINGKDATYDANGKLKYYYENDNGIITCRDNTGNLIGSTEDKGNYSKYEIGSQRVYKNENGEIVAIVKITNYTDDYGAECIYKNADGNEITKDEFDKLKDERLH